MEKKMIDSRRELLEHVTKAIDAIQIICSDSRTPLAEAIKLVRPLRRLTDCRRELEEPAFVLDSDTIEYSDTIAKLKKVGSTLKSDLRIRDEHIRFVALAEDAVSAARRIALRAIAPSPVSLPRGIALRLL
jgi:hypothetical protein